MCTHNASFMTNELAFVSTFCVLKFDYLLCTHKYEYTMCTII